MDLGWKGLGSFAWHGRKASSLPNSHNFQQFPVTTALCSVLHQDKDLQRGKVLTSKGSQCRQNNIKMKRQKLEKKATTHSRK